MIYQIPFQIFNRELVSRATGLLAVCRGLEERLAGLTNMRVPMGAHIIYMYVCVCEN